MEPLYELIMGNILIFYLKHSKLHFFALTLYKENFKKHKVKFQKSVFWNSELLNLIKSCLVALVCIPEVLMLLLTPILPYLYMACVGWHMCQIWHFWHFWHKWHICHTTFLMSRYGNMGVKRCVWTSGMQTNTIKQVFNKFNSSNFQNTDFQNFPSYFLKFPLYNGTAPWG